MDGMFRELNVCQNLFLNYAMFSFQPWVHSFVHYNVLVERSFLCARQLNYSEDIHDHDVLQVMELFQITSEIAQSNNTHIHRFKLPMVAWNIYCRYSLPTSPLRVLFFAKLSIILIGACILGQRKMIFHVSSGRLCRRNVPSLISQKKNDANFRVGLRCLIFRFFVVWFSHRTAPS